MDSVWRGEGCSTCSCTLQLPTWGGSIQGLSKVFLLQPSGHVQLRDLPQGSVSSNDVSIYFCISRATMCTVCGSALNLQSGSVKHFEKPCRRLPPGTHHDTSVSKYQRMAPPIYAFNCNFHRKLWCMHWLQRLAPRNHSTTPQTSLSSLTRRVARRQSQWHTNSSSSRRDWRGAHGAHLLRRPLPRGRCHAGHGRRTLRRR